MTSTESWQRGDWMQTHSGRRFYPLDPHPEDVDINDIAQGLSHLCRYAGQVDRCYCPTPEQRVLTADLRWVPAGELQIGDELLAFDEHPVEPGMAGNLRRRFRHSTVLHAVPVRRRVVRLELADGSSIAASAEHPWLVATKVSRNQTWATAADLATAVRAGRRRYMHRFVTPWTAGTTYDDGWLGGIIDGEGHISYTNRRGVQFGVAQRPGLVLKQIEANLDRLGFGYCQRPVGASDVISVQIYGGWREMARLLGTVRPVRLLDKFTSGLRAGQFNKQLDGVAEPLEIVAAHEEGEQWVSGLETSTRTFICEGFGAHNSVAEHCVLLSHAVAPELALDALMHDAAEAYVVDVPRPLKRHLADYTQIEDRILDRIWTAIGRDHPHPYAIPAEVKAADTRILLDERAALMRNTTHRWDVDELEPLGVTVIGYPPPTARALFLARYRDLGGK